MEKHTLRVSSVVALVAFVMGLAFNFGGKSSEVGTLTLEVAQMRNSIDTLTTRFITSDKENSNEIVSLKAEYQAMSKKVDELADRIEYQHK